MVSVVIGSINFEEEGRHSHVPGIAVFFSVEVVVVGFDGGRFQGLVGGRDLHLLLLPAPIIA